MQGGASAVAARTPVQLIGLGARQRRSPMGGAAKGTPLNTARSPWVTPWRSPPETWISAGDGAPRAPPDTASTASNAERILFIPVPRGRFGAASLPGARLGVVQRGG